MGKVIDKSVDEQIHNGRREKLRQSFSAYGLETFNETQVLEFALGMVVPRIDTNPTAHRLINTFGSLDGVISAHPDKLRAVAGVGDTASTFLHFLKQFTVYIAGIEREKRVVRTPNDAVEVLRDVMKLYPVEHFIVLCLDVRGNLILHQNIRGNIDKVNINTREIVDTVLRVGSYSVVFAHNHPDGAAQPSDADIHLTRTLIAAMNLIGVSVVDHIIFGSGAHYSFTLSGLTDVLRRDCTAFIANRSYRNDLPTNSHKN